MTDIYLQARQLLLDLPTVQAWPAMRAVVERVMRHRNRHWRVPVVACTAVGGQAQAGPALAALACLHTSIILIDDLLDADPRGEYYRLGMPAAANLAAAFQALGLEVLAQAPVTASARLAALSSLNRAALEIALGQQLDISPTGNQSLLRFAALATTPCLRTVPVPPATTGSQ